jgi:hypothetical protein
MQLTNMLELLKQLLAQNAQTTETAHNKKLSNEQIAVTTM